MKLSSPECTFTTLNSSETLEAIRKVLKHKSGIYGFVCVITGQQYIGSAQDLAHRAGEHLKGNKSNIRLQRAIAKHGIENFVFVVYEFAPYVTPDILELETAYIGAIDPALLFNLRLSATSMLGYKHTTAAIHKMIARLADPTKHPFFGKKHTEESLKLISKPGELNPMYGKKHSDATRALFARQKSRPVYSFDADGKFLESFTSGKAAADHYKVNKSTIGRHVDKPKLLLGLYSIRSSR